MRIYKNFCKFNFILFSALNHLHCLQSSTIAPKNYRLIDDIKFADHIKKENPLNNKLVKHKYYDEDESDGIDKFYDEDESDGIDEFYDEDEFYDKVPSSNDYYSASQPSSGSYNRCLPVKMYAKKSIIRNSFYSRKKKANKVVCHTVIDD
jgi:hypothetical protein